MIALLPELILVVSALMFAAAAQVPRKGPGRMRCARPLLLIAALATCCTVLPLFPLPQAGPAAPILLGYRPDALAQYGKALLAAAFFALLAAGFRNRSRKRADKGPGPGRAALLLLFLLALMVEVGATNLWLVVAAFVGAVATQHAALAPEGRAARRRFRLLLHVGAAAGGLMALGAGYLLGLCGASECGDIARCPAQPDLLPLRLAAVLLLASGCFLQLGLPPLPLRLPATAGGGKSGALPGENVVGLFLLPGAAALIVLIRLLPLLPPEAAAAPLPAAPGLAALWLGALGALAGKRVRDVFVCLALAQSGGVVLALTPCGDAGESAGLALYALLAETLALCAAALALACRPQAARPRGPLRPLALRDLQGLAFREPLLTGVLTCALAGLAGLPPTSAFMARFLTLTRMAQAGQGILALLGALGCLLALAACLKVLRPLYAAPPPEAPSSPPPLPALALGLALGLGLVLPGLLPAKGLTFLEAIARSL